MLGSVTFSVGLWGGSTSGRHGRLGKVTPTQGSLADGVRPNKHTHTHSHTHTHTLTHVETPHTRSQPVADSQPADIRCSNTRCEWAPLAHFKKKKEEHLRRLTHECTHSPIHTSHISGHRHRRRGGGGRGGGVGGGRKRKREREREERCRLSSLIPYAKRDLHTFLIKAN